MKKAYTKPELYFENFSLMGSIANTCGHNVGYELVNSAELGPCGFIDPALDGLIVFNTVNGACELGGVNDQICAGAPNEAGVLFGS